MTLENGLTCYEDFGAVGDGVADDLPAIVATHEHANAHNLSVRSRPDATYHLGTQALTVVIGTDTDWNTSRFTIDDSVQVEDHRKPLFEIRSFLEPEELRIEQLTRDQERLGIHPRHDCHVLVENDKKRIYIRRGLNQNAGVPQHDCFILHQDGSIEGAIDWDYTTITRVETHPIDTRTLFIRGGIFTTFANRMRQEIGYNYWQRNLVVTRSNTEIIGLTHYVVGETSVGHPYSGFLSIRQCANVTLRDCFATGHRLYKTIGAAGKPVSMGSYDYGANNVVNFRMIGCRMNHICDRTRWGVIASNFCKNLLLEDCVLSRMDTHMGVSGTYTIRRCSLGHMGLNAIGRGQLTIEDSTLYGGALINFRSDYGSNWEGDIAIRDCRWIPACGEKTQPRMIGVSNDGTHDFGYPCSMPREVLVDGLFVDDSNHPDEYEGMVLFSNPDGGDSWEPPAATAEKQPFPYARCQKVKIRRLTTASGKPIKLAPNAGGQTCTVVDAEG